MPPLPTIAALLLGLALIEGSSYWWMHPAPVGLGQPVLVYRSQARGPLTVDSGQTAELHQQPSPNVQQPPRPSDSSIPPTANRQPPTTTPLPEIYAKAAPMLRCTSGQVNYSKLSDTSGIHLAFFEWDGTDTGSVLEAFRHMPEACMGSIGMTLVSKEKPVPYTVDGETLLFDHTVFREPSQGGRGPVGSPLIHAYRAVWVAGLSNANARAGVAGDEFERLRTIRLKCAVNRFRPAHARVIQGAVRGIPNPDLAWETFENAMLKDLHMER